MPKSPPSSKPSNALTEAAAGWDQLFDSSIGTFDKKSRQSESEQVSDFPASKCSLFDPRARPAKSASKSDIVVALMKLGRSTSSPFIAGLADEASVLCEKSPEEDARVSLFVPPGTDAAITRRVVAAAIRRAGCTPETVFGAEYPEETVKSIADEATASKLRGKNSQSDPESKMGGALAAEDQEWARRGPAPTEEVLAELTQLEQARKPRAMILVDAMRRAINPFRAVAVLRHAGAPDGRIVIAERLTDTLSTGQDHVDIWRVAPDGLGFLLRQGIGRSQRCAYVSSRAAVVAMGRSETYDPSEPVPYGDQEWGGLKDASKSGRPSFGAFVLGVWYAVQLPTKPQTPHSTPAGPWDVEGFEERIAASLGSAGQGLAAVRSRCVSLAPQRDAPWLKQFARHLTSSSFVPNTTKPNDVTTAPGEMLKGVWFTRFGWYFNLLSILQAVPKCGRVLMVSSHESLVPKMLRSASCAQLGCRPKFDSVDWPMMDIQRLDDALKSGYIPGGESGYDMVVLDQVLEHVPHLMRATDSVRRLLKPGGSAVIAMPATNPVHHGPMDMWRAQLDGMLVVGSAIGRVDGCGTAVAPRYQAELAHRYPKIYKFPLKDPALMAMAEDEGSFAGAPPDGSMASTAWVVATRE